MGIKVCARIKDLGNKVHAVWTLSLCGMGVSTRSKVLTGVGMGVTVVGLVATSPVVVKTACALSGAMFCAGLVEGFRESMKLISVEEEACKIASM